MLKRLSIGMLVSTAVLAATIGNAHAQAVFTFDGVGVTKAEYLQFLNAMQHALTEGDTTIPLIVSVKNPAEMPAYDLLVHYAGIQPGSAGTPVPYVWFNSDKKGPQTDAALAAAFALAVSDGGYAGPVFKRLYEAAAAEDAKLPAGAPDPFLNRHKLGAALAASFDTKP